MEESKGAGERKGRRREEVREKGKNVEKWRDGGKRRGGMRPEREREKDREVERGREREGRRTKSWRNEGSTYSRRKGKWERVQKRKLIRIAKQRREEVDVRSTRGESRF